MKTLTNFAVVMAMAATAACGAVDPSDPGNDGGTAGMAGAGGGNNGGSGGGGGNSDLPFDASDIQLNDVSILFPLPANNKERDAGLLGADAKGAHGVLLPSSIYQAIGPVSGRTGVVETGGTPSAAYADLHVVAVRVDPCFAELEVPADGEGCDNQLRLVVQEVKDGTAFDSALHLFYSISRAELLELVSRIGALRQSLSNEKLGKLQPHPLMVEQGLTGAMAKGVRDAVLAYAGSDNLLRVTRMSESNGPFWDFSGFDIQSGKVVPMKIPTLPAGEDEKQTFVRNFSNDTRGNAEPPSGSEDDFMVLMNPPEAQALSEEQQQVAWSKLLRVESPTAHSPNTVDCVSCHIATPATKLVVEPVLGLTNELDAELVATFENEEPLTNVHAFSYTGKNVGINQRTVNETAAVADYLSQQDFGK